MALHDPGSILSTILRHDTKLTSYKIALLRAINDVVLAFPDAGSDGRDVAVPLRILADFWVAYYWPFINPQRCIASSSAGAKLVARLSNGCVCCGLTKLAMQEIDVLRKTRSFLLEQGLIGQRVVDLYTDAHPTLIGDASLRPFQRFTLALEGFTVHPDLVGRLDDGETTFAIETKGSSDHLGGLAQAMSTGLASTSFS